MSERHQEQVENFRQYLRRERLKSTKQRELIVEVFADIQGHVTVEDLLDRCRARDPKLGYATVYRTLKLLVDAGIASAWNFGEGFARYEPQGDDHHDHLFCLSCGRIDEFHDSRIEGLQESVAEDLGFELTHHRHEIYGVCHDCFAREGEQILQKYVRSPRLGEGQVFGDSFRRFLGTNGLKYTKQRGLIAELFADLDQHVRVEELYALARERDQSIGSATVYRTLKLLVDAGLAACRHFGDGFTRFEPRDELHHDHLIDVDSGDVIEFHDERIEARQDKIVSDYGYRVSHHRHDLFGRPFAAGREEAEGESR